MIWPSPSSIVNKLKIIIYNVLLFLRVCAVQEGGLAALENQDELWALDIMSINQERWIKFTSTLFTAGLLLRQKKKYLKVVKKVLNCTKKGSEHIRCEIIFITSLLSLERSSLLCFPRVEKVLEERPAGKGQRYAPILSVVLDSVRSSAVRNPSALWNPGLFINLHYVSGFTQWQRIGFLIFIVMY